MSKYGAYLPMFFMSNTSLQWRLFLCQIQQFPSRKLEGWKSLEWLLLVELLTRNRCTCIKNSLAFIFDIVISKKMEDINSLVTVRYSPAHFTFFQKFRDVVNVGSPESTDFWKVWNGTHGLWGSIDVKSVLLNHLEVPTIPPGLELA